MSTAVGNPPLLPSEPRPIPPLRNGDRLTAAEFERRFDAMPGLKKAELINGVVYVPSPVIFEDHGGSHFDLITWMGFYRAHTPGVRGADNTTIRLPGNNRPQPDGCLFIQPELGGRVRIDAKGYVVGCPEFVGEVAATSENYGLHDKLEVYEQNGVQEYLVWRVFDKAIDWFVLSHGKFERLAPATNEYFHSEVLPGLWLDAAALIRGDLPAVMQAVQRGVATKEHEAFVEILRQCAATRPAT